MSTDDFNESSHIVKRSLGSKPRYLRKRFPTNRTCALKVALLGVGAGQDGGALDVSPQMGRPAELDRSDRELLSLAGAVEVTEGAGKVTGQSSLIEVDPRRVL